MINCDRDHDDYVGPFFLSKECTADLVSSAQRQRFNDTALADLTAATRRGFFVNHQFKRPCWKNISNHYLAWCMRWGLPLVSFHPHRTIATLVFDLTFTGRMLTQFAYEEADTLVYDHVVEFNTNPVSSPVRFQLGKVRTEDVEEIGHTLVEYAMFRTVNRQRAKVA